MDSSIFVSVVIPTRNRARLLADTITSLRAMTYPADRYEIIVVDDGSADNTQVVVGNLQDGQKPFVRYASQLHKGLNAARNRGLREALGDLIVFVDDDVEVPPTWLSAYVNAQRIYPEVPVFGGPVYTRIEGYEPLPQTCDKCEPLTTFDDFIRDGPDREVSWLPGGNMALKREAVEQVGFFNEEFTYGGGDEIEWQERVQRRELKLLYIANAWLWHRRTPEDMRYKLLKRRYLRGKWYVRLLVETEAKRIPSPIGALNSLRRDVGHALCRRCFMGVARAATRLGHIAGWLKWVLPRKLRTCNGLRR